MTPTIITVWVLVVGTINGSNSPTFSPPLADQVSCETLQRSKALENKTTQCIAVRMVYPFVTQGVSK